MLYSISDKNVQEIKISPGIMLLFYKRAISNVLIYIRCSLSLWMFFTQALIQYSDSNGDNSKRSTGRTIAINDGGYCKLRPQATSILSGMISFFKSFCFGWVINFCFLIS